MPPLHPADGVLHKDHPTSVAFFDETGAISSDRFFVVGLLRVRDHSGLLKDVKTLRKKERFFDEFKWSGITAANASTYQQLIDLLLGSDISYSAFVADRHVADPVSRFGDAFAAYEKLATQLLIGNVPPFEMVSVPADNYSAPNNRSFESQVRDETNHRLGRLAVVSVVQVDSNATEGLQLVDVLTGAVGFSFRQHVGLASNTSNKSKVAASMRAQLGWASMNTLHRSPKFCVKQYEHRKWLLAEQAKVKSRRNASQISL